MPSVTRSLEGRRVLVTGGAGFIGGHIVRRLAQTGAAPVVVDTLDGYGFDQVERFGIAGLAHVVRGDASDPAVVGPLVLDADVVVHAAACADVAACTSDPDRDFGSMRAAQTVLEAARRSPGTRVVLASSAQVYGAAPADGALFREDDTPGEPGMLYANSKAWVERQGRLYGSLFGVPVTVLRFFSVYGPHQVPKPGSHSWAAAVFSVRALKGLPLVVHGDGSQVRDLVYVEDVADAVVAAATAPEASGTTVNVGTGTATTIADLAGAVADLVPGTEVVRGPRPEGDPDGGAADVARLERVLGTPARTDLAEGLRAYLDWARTNMDLVGGVP